MPSRAPIPRVRAGGGFGGFAANPSISYPGGRVLTSDVADARDAMNFGGTSNTPVATATPTTTPTPTPAPSISPTPGGLQPPYRVDPRWNGDPQIMDPNHPDYIPPTISDDVSGRLATRFVGGVDQQPRVTGVPSGGGRSPGVTDDPNADWRGIDTPGVASRGGRSPGITGDPNADWTGADPTGIDLAGNTVAGSGRGDGLPTDPGGMGDEPYIGRDGEYAGNQPTDRALEGDEWVTSPTDRRFLPTGNAVANSAGYDIGRFGGNLSLGQFLNTPLAMMRFGENRYQPGSGNPQVLVAGEQGMSSESNIGWRPSPDELANADANFAAAEDQGRRETPQRDAISVGGTLSNSSSAPIGSQDVAARWDPNSGTGNFMASQFTKYWEAGGQNPGNPNYTGNDRESGPVFQANASTPMGRVDQESGMVIASDRTFAGGRPDSRWVMPTQDESAALGLSFDARAFNEWLRSHNAWAYQPQGSG